MLIPARYIPELRGLPEEILSATEAVNEAMLSQYTKFSLGHNGHTLSGVVRTKLTQNLARLVPQLHKEIEYVVATEFPKCNGELLPPKSMVQTLCFTITLRRVIDFLLT